MDLTYSEEEEAFRARLRAWLSTALPELPPRPDPLDWPARRAYDTAWQRMLYDAGYAGLHWPEEAGGRGATPTQHLIYLEETEKAGAPYVGANFVGLLHAGPTVAAEGTPGSGPAGCRRSCAATRSGARASANPTRDPTSRRCAPARSATATTTS